MTTEQEALRLADLLQDEAGVDGYVHDEAAAMLRKLVAEREADRAAMREALEAAEFMRYTADHAWDESDYERVGTAITDLRKQLEGTT